MIKHSAELKPFLGVVLLNALLAFPVLYLIYKHFNPAYTPWDINSYMTMAAQGPYLLEPPFRYRYLVPMLVRGMRVLPGYPIPVVFSADPSVRNDFFHFALLNFCVAVSTSGLIFLYLKNRLRPTFAYLGSLLYLFSFFSVIANFIPMTDAGCHLAIISCVLLMEKERPFAFMAVCLVGVFIKETLLVVLPLWILVQSFSDRRRLFYLAYAAPAATAYLIVTRLYPAPSSFPYYHSSFLLKNVLHAFSPSQYGGLFFFHLFLLHLPLLVSFLIFLYFKVSGKGKNLKINPELFLFFFLLWLGIVMGIGDNADRLAFMVFPAIIYFEAMILQAVAQRLDFA
jgi:hypothetical protein